MEKWFQFQEKKKSPLKKRRRRRRRKKYTPLEKRQIMGNPWGTLCTNIPMYIYSMYRYMYK
jgi:hypothetical protein